MEGKTMGHVERRGGTVQGVLPRPEKKKGEIKKPLIERLAKNLAVRAALAGIVLAGAGYAAYSKYEEAPLAIRRPVDEFLGRVPSEDIPLTFDTNAISGIIAPSMIERIPQEEIDRLFPTPFGKIEDRNTVQILYFLDVSTSTNPDAIIKYRLANNSDGNEQDRINRAKEGFLNQFQADNVPAGTIIRAPIDGMLMVFTASGNNTPVNDHDYDTANIRFQRPDGKEDVYIISGGTKSRGDVFKSLTNAPAVGGSRKSPEEAKTLEDARIFVKAGTPILQVTNSEIMLVGYPRGTLPDRIGKEIRQSIPTNAEFFQTPDGKLIMSASTP